MIRVAIEPTFDSFRERARPLLAEGTPPEDILWEDTSAGQGVLFGEAARGPSRSAPPSTRRALRVPAGAMELARLAAFHGERDRFALFYRIFFRLTHAEPHLLEVASDPDVARLRAMVQSVRRDEHKMHAFVRFRRVDIAGDDVPWFVAWYRPEHPIVRLAAPFFERRFASMRWSILTPAESAHWDGKSLRFGPGVPRDEAPPADEFEEMFRTYYRAIFNPARVNLEAMRAEMPKKFWAALPETRAIDELVRDASLRVDRMRGPLPSASGKFVPADRSLAVLAEAARGCRACELCVHATQAVFGECASGEAPAAASGDRRRVMLVGEQPGDAEDLAGRPFVGPAGRVLDGALERAGVDRKGIYVTNAVKHFKFEPRGKRRIHQRPTYGEVQACRAWLDAEIETVRPDVIVCLGSTAAQSFMGKRFQVTKRRGQVERTRWAPVWLATWHPSAILRAADDVSGKRMFEDLVADLALARATLEGLVPASGVVDPGWSASG